MPELQIAGIMRATAYSPNHIGNDSLIFGAVTDRLRKRGVTVTVYNEEQLCAGMVKERVVLNMCRDPRSIELLQRMEDEGALVVNSGYAIYNCTRERCTRILGAHGIPLPPGMPVSTDERIIPALEAAGYGRAWIKRADRHARHKEDVCFVRHPREAQEVLQEFFLRGIPRAVVSAHVPGDLVKFYGVAGTKFFHWFYPHDGHISGEDEALNGAPGKYPFDGIALESTCRKAADLLGLTVFGGDCVVAPDGTYTIIDFKDWPSFAACREQAAPHIARRLLAMAAEHGAAAAGRSHHRP